MTDKKSLKAAAQLYRLAQARRLLRLYRESEGHDAPSAEALAAWRRRMAPSGEKIRPAGEDVAAIDREHPDLVALARRGNPHLSGEN
jgi:hypothetical protein